MTCLRPYCQSTKIVSVSFHQKKSGFGLKNPGLRADSLSAQAREHGSERKKKKEKTMSHDVRAGSEQANFISSSTLRASHVSTREADFLLARLSLSSTALPERIGRLPVV